MFMNSGRNVHAFILVLQAPDKGFCAATNINSAIVITYNN